MTERRHGTWGVAMLALASLVSIVGLALLPSAQPSVDEIVTASTVIAAETPSTTQPIADTTTSTSTSTTTTLPTIESLIPLSVEAISDQVSASVAFVLSQQGTGSGVIVSDEYLVTNAHVVWPDTTVSLVFLNGATFQGRVVAIDPFVDLAVVDITRLTRKPAPISIGSLGDVAADDELWVVGYPAPDGFTPQVTIDSGALLGVNDWEFTGVRWFTIEAPAIGGQSGGAVVDRYGRLVGISTFGSAASLTSISVDDVLVQVESLVASSEVRGLEARRIPHSGARRSNEFSLEGDWDQQLLVGWLRGDSDVTLEWAAGGVDLVATSIDGTEIATGQDRLDFVPFFAFPVVVAAEASQATAGSLESSLPLILYPDPDHGKTIPRKGATAGLYDVGGDRDFFYLNLEEGEFVSVTVESASRTRLRIYDPAGDIVAENNDASGFIGNNATVEMVAAASGRHVVSLESSLSTVAGYTVVTR